MSRSKYKYFKWILWGEEWSASSGITMLIRQHGPVQECICGDLRKETRHDRWLTTYPQNWKPLTYNQYRKELSNARKALSNSRT